MEYFPPPNAQVATTLLSLTPDIIGYIIEFLGHIFLYCTKYNYIIEYSTADKTKKNSGRLKGSIENDAVVEVLPFWLEMRKF